MKTVFLAIGFMMFGSSFGLYWISYKLDGIMGSEMCKYKCLGRNHCVAVIYLEKHLTCEIFTTAGIIRNKEKSTIMFTRKQLQGMKFQGDAQTRGAVQCEDQDVCIANHNRRLVCVDPTHIKSSKMRKLERPPIKFSDYKTESCTVLGKTFSFKNGSKGSSCLVLTSGGFNNMGNYYWTICFKVGIAARIHSEGKTKLCYFQIGQLNNSLGNGFSFLFEKINQTSNKVRLFHFRTDLQLLSYETSTKEVYLGFYIDVADRQFLVVDPQRNQIIGSVEVPTSTDIHFTGDMTFPSVESCELVTGAHDLNQPPRALLKRTHLTLEKEEGMPTTPSSYG